ncbi:Elongation factor 1-beta [Dirofilaria immitis]
MSDGNRDTEHRKGKRKDHKDKSHSDDTHETPIASDGLRDAIASARMTIKQALEDTNGDDATSDALTKLNGEVAALKKISDEMRNEIEKLREDFQKILNYAQQGGDISTLQKQSSSSKIEKSLEELREDDFDLFGSSEDEKDEEKERIKQERLKAYAEKKAKKPETVAKSSIIFEVKPWDDTTDMRELEKLIREIKQDGLVWGDSKLVPLAFGIYILQIVCVVEDEKVGVDDIISNVIEEAPEHVQSVDVVAFNKV